jgi:acetyl esterase/lipase
MIMFRDVVKPTLVVYPAASAKRTGVAVIICPGGGGVILDWKNEGTNVAEWLANQGVTAFVLKYRLAPTPEAPPEFERFMKDHSDSSWKTGLALGVADARQAMKVVRQRASEWSVSTGRIGLMGFSMGGYVAMGVVMNHEPDNSPSFVAAIYGGETGGRQIPSDGPPLFAAVAQDDAMMAGPVVRLYSEWKTANLPAELHVFERGGHGFGTIKQGLPVDRWLDLFADWLTSQRQESHGIK